MLSKPPITGVSATYRRGHLCIHHGQWRRGQNGHVFSEALSPDPPWSMAWRHQAGARWNVPATGFSFCSIPPLESITFTPQRRRLSGLTDSSRTTTKPPSTFTVFLSFPSSVRWPPSYPIIDSVGNYLPLFLSLPDFRFGPFRCVLLCKTRAWFLGFRSCVFQDKALDFFGYSVKAHFASYGGSATQLPRRMNFAIAAKFIEK